MTKRMYIGIRLLLKNDGHDILPVYDKLNEYRKEKRPPLEKLQDPYKEIKVDYKKALEKSAYQLLKTINLSKLENLEEIHLKVHDGLDGSGGHSIFNQKK